MIEIKKDFLLKLHWSKVKKMKDFLKDKPESKGVYLWILELNNKYFPWYVGTSFRECEKSIYERQVEHVNNMRKNLTNMYNIENLILDDKDVYECVNDFSSGYGKREKNKERQETKYFICNNIYEKNETNKNTVLDIAEKNIEHSLISYLDLTNVHTNFESNDSIDLIKKCSEKKYLAELLEGVLIKFIKNKMNIEFYSDDYSVLGRIQRTEFKEPTNLLIENHIENNDQKYFEILSNEFFLFVDNIKYQK